MSCFPEFFAILSQFSAAAAAPLSSPSLAAPTPQAQGLRRCVEEIVFTCAYPRLDMQVSKHMTHLLKAPFCIHPKTERVCVPINPDDCDYFDPTTVPTLSEQTEVGNENLTGHIISTTIGGKNGEAKQTISYMVERVVGTGSFGIVFQAKCLETAESVAIKKVLQDKRYKNRELQLMRSMDHPNVISLKHCFFSTTSEDELFLNLVMEYVPETVYRVLKHYSNVKQQMPLVYVKLYMYQIFRGLAYIHTVPGVCHRDVKPPNLLVDPLTHQVKLCDFGSAKVFVKGEANISYIFSRYYRAPELIFGATEYTTTIDIWSAGCVLAELLLGQPLFPGESVVDQLVEIIKVLGTPTREDIRCMNPNYTEFRFPQINAHPWHKAQGLRRCVEEIVFTYAYPRLDMQVSKHMTHLLKAPFCIHPKTVRVCVPINPDDCDYFDPTTVPTLSEFLFVLESKLA